MASLEQSEIPQQASTEEFNDQETVAVECVDMSETSLTLGWNSIPSVIKWELEWRPSNTDESWKPLGSKGFKTAMPPKQKSGLTPGTSFDFRVRGRDSVDWYGWGPVRTYSTLKEGTQRLPPITLKNAEDGALTVAWTIPEGITNDENNQEKDENEKEEEENQIKYELQIRESTLPIWTTISSKLTGNIAKKKNLSKDSFYHFRIKPVGYDENWTYSISNTNGFKPTSPLAPFFKELFGNQLIDAHGNSKSIEKLAGYVVAVYFSASWCGPCRQFTPQLANLYQAAKAAGRKFEVVFVSADRDEGSMKEYLGHMPWSAVPFSAPQRQQIQAKFQVNGIPNLKVFSPKGVLLDDNAVQSGNLTMPNLTNWEKV